MTSSGHVWQAGVVVHSTEAAARIRFEPLTHCQRCLRGEGCGAGVFSRLFAGRRAELDLPTDHRLAPGQPVRVGIRSGTLVRLAVVIYGLPVVVFILAAAATATLLAPGWEQDVLSLLGGLAAAALALVFVARRRTGALNPIVETLSAGAGRPRLESGPDQGHI
ncbi:SoxR reducing system RseC family protein [Wenzhouxiangella limi]|uniref:Fis family transcriptional regulator n=1 Tax=Wenzhouxiangella limi TaxID=2707351 RepID=A0A845UZI0_9GAMM|nr:SoxR reducing system RseC family protein [Wenzhouxiangella limi]NDY94466.1 hypothetical protein [Wenzhouxiangella limi]